MPLQEEKGELACSLSLLCRGHNEKMTTPKTRKTALADQLAL